MCGVDFVQSISMITGLKWNLPIGKTYICNFVCFATKTFPIGYVSSLALMLYCPDWERFGLDKAWVKQYGIRVYVTGKVLNPKFYKMSFYKMLKFNRKSITFI